MSSQAILAIGRDLSPYYRSLLSKFVLIKVVFSPVSLLFHCVVFWRRTRTVFWAKQAHFRAWIQVQFLCQVHNLRGTQVLFFSTLKGWDGAACSANTSTLTGVTVVPTTWSDYGYQGWGADGQVWLPNAARRPGLVHQPAVGAANAGSPLALSVQCSGFKATLLNNNFSFLPEQTDLEYLAQPWLDSFFDFHYCDRKWFESAVRQTTFSPLFTSPGVDWQWCTGMGVDLCQSSVATPRCQIRSNSFPCLHQLVGLDWRLSGHCGGLGHPPQTQRNLPSGKAATATCTSRKKRDI